MSTELFYGIALSQLKGIGDAYAKILISYAGSAENIFKLSKTKLQKINGIGPKLASIFNDTYEAQKIAEREMAFVEKNNIEILFYYDKRYPKRLLHCADAPLYIFSKGNVDFNKDKFVNIIGTRHATEYGKAITENLINVLAQHQVHIVSGLAYGIDICAHKSALKYDIQNIAVLAHGLDIIYPNQHKNIAERLQQNGALVTTYLSGTIPDKGNFPNRNRIVAGMTDATIVVESAEKGGALITAEIANSYNRDVFAYPGKITDTYSKGCLKLIKQLKAQLVTNADDILQSMNWIANDDTTAKPSQQTQLFLELNEQEQAIVDMLKNADKLHIDVLSASLPITLGKLSSILLQLEMQGIIQSLPGKQYKLIV